MRSGTQAIQLARNGFHVVGMDPSKPLLAQLTATAHESGVSVETLHGNVEDLDRVVAGRDFDLVLAHGLLMYLDDARAAVTALSRRVASGGVLSLTFRNRDALAYRPSLRGQWQRALEGFDATTYVNELGASARAHGLHEMTGWVEGPGLIVERLYGFAF